MIMAKHNAGMCAPEAGRNIVLRFVVKIYYVLCDSCRCVSCLHPCCNIEYRIDVMTNFPSDPLPLQRRQPPSAMHEIKDE